MNWDLINTTLVTPDQINQDSGLTIRNGLIEKIFRRHSSTPGVTVVDLSGMIVLPGLIDCHDHLLGTYLPRVGDRKPYLNWLIWDNDLKASPIYAERQQIESQELYLLGGFRHLLCGITTVQDHIPHFVQDMFKAKVPIKIVDKYAVAHSATSFGLPWGDSIEKEIALALDKDIPFIVHCSEGYDKETIDSVSYLNKKNAITDHTVLIHGIAFSDSDIKLIAEKKSHVVWCPVSNLYMFEDTAPIKKLIDASVNVTLGTDSPMSGSINIFEEIDIAKNYYNQQYSEKLDDKLILEMLTTNAAKAMFLPDRGRLKEGCKADLLVINGDQSDPYGSFTSMNYGNIMLVVIDGRPLYAHEAFSGLFDALEVDYQNIIVDGHPRIIHGDVLGLIDRVRKSVGFKKELAFLPVEPGR